MRPQQQNRRMRGRNNNNNNNNNNNRKGPNPLTRSYESNGPDVKIRGSAQQIAEKYTTLARDATSSGDRVMAENYLQHAEHYNRIIAAAQAQMPIQHFGNREEGDEDMDDERDEFDPPFPAQPQPPQQQNFQNQQRHNNERGDRNQGGQNGGRQFDGERRRDDRNQNERGDNRSNEQQAAHGGQNNGSNGYHPVGEAAQSAVPNPAEAPQPVIEGVPAEVAYGADNNGGEGNNRRRERRNRFNERFNRDRDAQPRDGGEQPQQAESAASEQAAPIAVEAPSPVAAEPVEPAAVAAAPEAEGEAPSRRGRRPRRTTRAQGEEGTTPPPAGAEFEGGSAPAETGAAEG
ncbi:MAG: DUF4167 domain-containing protein [Mesorhizobium amorphae]|nr:MAG: DUF4167 domain-containing protein [Mesorhizobium amorphae]